MTKKYIGTKIITAFEQDKKVGENGIERGYGVIYEDGYQSWSPKETFDAAYRAIEGDEQALTFGDAIHMLKMGAKVARSGWNGKGMFIYYVPADHYPARTEAAKSHFGGSLVPYNAYLAIKNVNETVSTWVPSINDCLAEDWIVVQ